MPRSLKFRTGVATVSSLFILCTALACWSRWDSHKSIATQKELSRSLANTVRMDRLMGKQMSAITVQIANPKTIPEQDGQEVRLVGYVTANHQPDSNVEYQWDLPAGVAVVSGNINGSIPDMQSGDTAEIEIHVTGFSREVGKHIVLFGKIRHGEDELTHSALISSRPEDSLEYVAPKIREFAEQTRSEEFRNGRLVK